MDLSIIIVSYNVLPFLRQSMAAVQDACKHLDYELIVVDNNSEDGSDVFLEGCENNIKVILNNDNVGYAKGMNQGLKVSQGRYTLFLNPDTLISLEAIDKCIKHLDENNTCGAVGVRMMDGKGDYLKESKRGYPTLLSAIFKSMGLSNLFPTSSRFAHYYQGQLNPDENHIVDTLTGAFFLTRKPILDELEGFDERYFMYGEDIDLSKSIQDLGYYNYYIGKTSIIHFKGESTRKDTIKNTFHFYNSMLLFAEKYSSQHRIYIWILSLILGLLGGWRWFKLKLIPFIRPLVRYGSYVLSFYIVGQIWSHMHFNNVDYLSHSIFIKSILVYSLILLSAFYINRNSYNRFKNLMVGVGLILIGYGLLPSELRSSRAVIILGSSLIVLFELLFDFWNSYQKNGRWSLFSKSKKALLLSAANNTEVILQLLRDQEGHHYLGAVSESLSSNPTGITDFEHIEGYLANHEVDILTIHMESISMDKVMQLMSQLGSVYKYLLYSENNQSIISSPNSNVQGQVSVVEIRWGIDSSENRTLKRTLDIFLSISFMVFSPLLIWFVHRRRNWFSNIGQSLIGKFTWVGYNTNDLFLDRLPQIKPSILKIDDDIEHAHQKNVQYARDYSLIDDLRHIINSFEALGNKVEKHARHK